MPDENEPVDYQSLFTEAMTAKSAASSPPVSGDLPRESSPPESRSAPPEAPPPEAPETSSSPPPAPPVTAQPELKPEPPRPAALLQQFREAGLDLPAGTTEENLVEVIARQYKHLVPFAQYGQQLMPYQDQLAEFFQSRMQPEQTEEESADVAQDFNAGEYFQGKWDVPKWDAQYDVAVRQGIVQRDPETGYWQAAPGHEMLAGPVIQGMNAHQDWNAQKWQEITRGNPYQNFYEVLLEPLRQAWKQDLQEEIARRDATYEVSNSLDRFERENSHWMFEADGRTASARGQEFFRLVEDLKNDVPDVQRRVEIAAKLVQSVAPSASAQPTAASPPSTPAASAVVPPPPSPQEANLKAQQSFLQSALERTAHAAQADGFPVQAQPSNPVVLTDGELNSMFVEAFKSNHNIRAA